jgi:hypothetical protein
LLRGDLLRVAKPGPCRCKRRGPNTPPAFQTKVHLQPGVNDDWTDDWRPRAPMMLFVSALAQKTTFSDD